MHTNFGDLRGVLFAGVAPKTVNQLTILADAGVLDTTWFVRIEPGFVAQITTAQGRIRELRADEMRLITKIPLEPSGLQHHRGSLSMPHPDDDVNGGETSFCIMLADAPHLDGKYTVFGMIDPADKLLAAIEATGKLPREQRPRVEVTHVDVQ